MQTEMEAMSKGNEESEVLNPDSHELELQREETEDKKKRIGYRDILNQKRYIKVILASVINRFGDSVDSIAFTWLVYQVTQSAAWSAVIFGVNKLPTIFLQPFAGAMVEEMNKKKVMVITDIIRGICVGGIATAMLLGIVNQWMLLGTTLVISSAEAFRNPASTALIPKLLERKYYEFGTALNSSISTVMELVGLGLAGAIIALGGISTAIYIDMATFFISALIIATLRNVTEQKEKQKIQLKRHVQDMKEGFQYIKVRKILMYFITLGIFVNAITVPLNSLQAPMVSEMLHSGEIMLSVFSFSLSIGMLIGSALFPYLIRKVKKSTMLTLGCYMIGVYYMALVLAGKMKIELLLYGIVILASGVTGIIIAQLNSMMSVEFMKLCDESYLARAAAIMNAGVMATMPIASFLIGILAKFLSTQILFIIAGVAAFLAAIYLCKPKKLRGLNLNQCETE